MSHVSSGASHNTMRREAAEARPKTAASDYNVDDLGDMLDELRVLLPSAQLLSAFLMTLPFIAGFAKVDQSEKWVFAATFICSVASLVLLSAPATQHRLMWPLKDRVAFKRFASFEILIGAVMLSFALTLGTHLVISEALGASAGLLVSGSMALLVSFLWWLLPIMLKHRSRTDRGQSHST